MATADKIRATCRELEELLLEKNAAYGDTALNPLRVFSQADRTEQLKARIDDKLSRVKNNPEAFGEDVVKDLLGYLIMLRIAQRETAPEVPQFEATTDDVIRPRLEPIDPTPKPRPTPEVCPTNCEECAAADPWECFQVVSERKGEPGAYVWPGEDVLVTGKGRTPEEAEASAAQREHEIRVRRQLERERWAAEFTQPDPYRFCGGHNHD